MDQKEFDQLLERYLHGRASESEKALVDQWYHRISSKATPLRRAELTEIRKRTESVLTANKEKTSGDTEVSRPVYRMWGGLALPAAACAAFILIAFSLYVTSSYVTTSGDISLKESGTAAASEKPGWKKIVNTASLREVLILDDGSEITLSPGSVLEYPSHFDVDKREVRLQRGSAFFSIKEDPKRPFYVYSSNVVTRVLGTSFFINAYAQGRVTVDVKTGTVKVSTRLADIQKSENDEIILRPNQRADYDPKRHSIIRTLVEKPRMVIPAEEVANMTFEKAPVASILAAVEKAYQVEIRFDSVKFSSCTLTTHLIPDEDLYTRLKIICEAIDATYFLANGQIRITGKGC